jgi:F-type H+-transporting ATPase subunit b
MAALFSTFGINTSLLLIQAVNFAIVLLVLWWFLFKPLNRVLDERRKKIAKGVEDAAAAAEARANTEMERTGIISAAQNEAEAVVGRAVEEGKSEQKTIIKKAQERSEAILAEAATHAEELRRKSLAESEKDVARLAILAAERILKES